MYETTVNELCPQTREGWVGQEVMKALDYKGKAFNMSATIDLPEYGTIWVFEIPTKHSTAGNTYVCREYNDQWTLTDVFRKVVATF